MYIAVKTWQGETAMISRTTTQFIVLFGRKRVEATLAWSPPAFCCQTV